MFLGNIKVDKLDEKFLNRAEKVTSFNIQTSDFITVNPVRKNEIRYLFLRYFYPRLNSNVFIKSNTITKQDLNSSINKLKSADSLLFLKMHNYNLKGIGPGEVTVYFIYDNAYLGGGTSKGADINIGSHAYEVKAVKVNSGGIFYNFYTGGTVDISEYIADILALAKANGITGTMQAVSAAKTREADPVKFKKIEEAYAKKIYDEYFSLHDTIFINSSTGVAEAVMSVLPKQIGIGEITQGKIKPTVNKNS